MLSRTLCHQDDFSVSYTEITSGRKRDTHAPVPSLCSGPLLKLAVTSAVAADREALTYAGSGGAHASCGSILLKAVWSMPRASRRPASCRAGREVSRSAGKSRSGVIDVVVREVRLGVACGRAACCASCTSANSVKQSTINQ